ncbi:MAG: FG-GAP-like repeat-containing protein, partial [Porticoccaceae bacterium]|nr:FG-GAP-like repeat-containing protein [Porticoccaceae bacterium]
MEASIALQSIKSYIKLTLLVFGMMFLASESPAVDFTENFEDKKFIHSSTAKLSTEEEAVYLAWTKRHGSHDFAATGTGIQNDKDGTYAVALADVDRDGDLDLVAGSYTGSKLYLNKGGHRGFDAGILIGNGVDTVYGVALGDMDGDGDVDLVVGNSGEKSKLYLNEGGVSIFDDGTAFGSGSDNTRSVALADMDGDGDLDLVVGNYFQKNKLYLNSGADSEHFNDGIAFGDSANTHSVALADMDGDGNVDVVEGNYEEQNKLYLNEGTIPAGGFTYRITPIGSEKDDTQSVALGDMNGDGKVDVVAGNNGKTNKLYLNPGSGAGFASVTGAPIGSDGDSTESVALADVDGDGNLDVVAGNIGQTNKLYLNKGGDGGFASVTGSDIGSEKDSTESVALADVDGDGDLDLVAGNYSNQINKLYLNKGFGGSAAINIGSIAESTQSVALADVDGDGDLDVVEGNTGENKLYLNKGYGVFPTTGIGIYSPYGSTESVALADMDGDGDPDLVVGNDGKNTLHLNTGIDPYFPSGTDIGSDSNDTESIALADVDGDGDLDLVAGNQDEINKLYLNIGGGSVFASTGTGKDIGSDQNSTQSVALADVDGDGDLDLVAGNQKERNKLYLNIGGDSVFASTGSDIGSDNASTQSVALADMDGDGDLDLVAGNYKQTTKLYLNKGGADGFASVTGSDIGTDKDSTYLVALADMDGDGDVDVVVGNVLQSKLYLNHGSDVFVVRDIGGDEVGLTYSIALGDMDGDGDLDLVEGNSGEKSKLYLNNASGGFATAGTAIGYEKVPGLPLVALADVDVDGDLDLVAGNYHEIKKLYLNNGSGVFATEGTAIGSEKDSTLSVALGDVNGDGKVDLVAGNSSTDGDNLPNKNKLYLNSGADSKFFKDGTNIIGSGTDRTWAVALADVDGDGNLDLVEGNEQTNKLYLNSGADSKFFKDGTNIEIAKNGYNNTRSVALADLDGDGDLDLVTGNLGVNKLYLNTGNPPFFGESTDIGSDAEATYSVALADVDGDGDLDLVVGNFGKADKLYLNNRGVGVFASSGIEIGSGKLSGLSRYTNVVSLADVNGDGDVDLVASSKKTNKLYLNIGKSPFFGDGIDIGGLEPEGRSAALADVDGDGDVDLVEGNAETDKIYKNSSYNINAGSIVSNKVNGDQEGISAVTLQPTGAVNTSSTRNTSIDYFVTNTGGKLWLKVIPNTKLNFPNKGTDDVRWRAELRSLSPVRTPKLSKVSLTYVVDEIAPTITSSTKAKDLAENTGKSQEVYTITAKDDIDGENGIASHQIGGTHASHLSVNSQTGAVTLTVNPDYEVQNRYHFTVTAKDNAGNTSDPKAVTLLITDVDDTAPTIISSTKAPDLDENSGAGQKVYTISAYDGMGGIASYQIGGRDKDDLIVDSKTGAVTLTANPNYEAKNNYRFTVTAKDTADNISKETTVTLTINNVDDEDPKITSAETASNVDENSGPGKTVYIIKATDDVEVK